MGGNGLLGMRFEANDGACHVLSGLTLEQQRGGACEELCRATAADDLTQVVEGLSWSHKAEALNWPKMLHSLRDAMRHKACQKAARRRPDMRDLPSLDREALANLWKIVPVDHRPTLRFLMQGAALTAAREHRSTRARVAACCPFLWLGG